MVGINRLSALGDKLTSLGHDALLVTTPSNITYLTGFTGSNGYVVAKADGSATIVTDSRYEERIVDELRSDTGLSFQIAEGSGRTVLDELIPAMANLAVEADHLSWSDAHDISTLLGSERVRPSSDVVESLRELKDDEELSLMRRAASIADSAFDAVLSNLRPGRSERDIAWAFAESVRSAGGDGVAYDTIVASGPNGSRPHHATGDRTLASGDLVIVDAGAIVGGYRSDMTRSFVLGTPTPRQQEMLDAVRVAQQVGVATVSPGVPACDIDAACRESLAAAGLAEWFTHGTGHGVGLDIHEAPSVRRTATATLAPGHVITVEPGVYLPGEGGVRWEDTVVVTSTGSETLTLTPKHPIIDL